MDWRYERDSDQDDDVCKAVHYAVYGISGERVTIDHSPYEGISTEAFEAHVSLGFPPRAGSGPWNNDTILKEKHYG